MKRIYHPWTKWECVPAGMYESVAPPPLTPDQARDQYRLFLRDIPRFDAALKRVLTEWPISCEQFLSNEHINRIAWLGQSSMCIDTGVPACFRSGFYLLDKREQRAANMAAQQALNLWLRSRGEADSADNQAIVGDCDDIESIGSADSNMGTVARARYYVEKWKRCGYWNDIPDEVPSELMKRLLAPSYKAICQAILKNDMLLKSLGFTAKESRYYGILKRIEIESRPDRMNCPRQLLLPFQSSVMFSNSWF